MNFRRLKLFSWFNGHSIGDCYDHHNARGESKRSGSVFRRIVARQVKKAERREADAEIEREMEEKRYGHS